MKTILKSLFILFIFTSCSKGKFETHTAEINQSNENAPTFQFLTKSKDFEIKWKRNAKGVYQGDFIKKPTGEFLVEISSPTNTQCLTFSSIADGYIQVYTTMNGEMEDGVLIGNILKIHVKK
jgi:hypothetical protein